MRNSDKRLNTIFQAFVDHFLVVAQASLVRFGFVAVGKDACPCNRKTIALEAHFGKQRDILAETVVVLNRLMAGIKCALLKHGRNALALSKLATRADIRNRNTLAVAVPSAFTLICGCRAAPQEILR